MSDPNLFHPISPPRRLPGKGVAAIIGAIERGRPKPISLAIHQEGQ